MEPALSGFHSCLISAKNVDVARSRGIQSSCGRSVRLPVSPSIGVTFIAERGGLSRTVSRQSGKADKVARIGAQRLHRGWKLQARSWQPKPIPPLRVLKKAGGLWRLGRCGICPMGALAHPMNAQWKLIWQRNRERYAHSACFSPASRPHYHPGGTRGIIAPAGQLALRATEVA
jgi:hypothetical protein